MEVYEHPRTRFVGDFLGRTIIMKGTMRNGGGQSWVDVQGQGRVTSRQGSEFSDGELVRILSRPEDIKLLPMGEPEANQVLGKIERIAYMGDHLEYTIAAAGRTLLLPATKKDSYAIGADIRLAFDPTCVTTLPQ
jgi:ABC-type Fe3+/spermidine/putrescine transport system ATPase subunit